MSKIESNSTHIIINGSTKHVFFLILTKYLKIRISNRLLIWVRELFRLSMKKSKKNPVS